MRDAPMLATSGQLPTGPDWAFEFKWDGVRAVASITGGTVALRARSGADITTAYPELAGLGAMVSDAVLDGELVVLDPEGRPSFTLLAERMHVRAAARAAALAASLPVTYMIFDLLAIGGVDLTGRPYTHRRTVLEGLGLADRAWLVPPRFDDGRATTAAATEYRLEGVVAKRLNSMYRFGTRSPDWVKVKHDETRDFVIGGYRPGARTIGALLVGVPGTNGLIFRGRVGGGISAASERALLAALRPLASRKSPFAQPLPREDAKDAKWVRPEVVVEVKYGNRTPDGRLRFPRFLRLRPDKRPEECVDAR